MTATRSEIIDPHALSDVAKARLTDQLYAIHCQIFDGVDKAAFAKYVVLSKAQQTHILVHKTAADQIVGYCAIHFFTEKLSGGTTTIVRMEAGSLREYRGSNRNARFTFQQLVGYRLKYPTRRMFYLGTLVHPSSYMLFDKYAPELWPNRQREMPADIKTLMQELKAMFGVEMIDPAHPWVVQVGWKTNDTQIERNYWLRSDRPAARFFVRENPTYSEGHGLMTLVPISFGALARASKQIVNERLYRRRESLLMNVQRIPGLGSSLSRRDVQRRLSQVDLFHSLNQQQLAMVAQAADIISMSPGSFLFHEGDPGTDMYILASGSVYVLDEHSEGNDIIDQLTPGTMFGELAMLAGEARAAAVRTATKSRLIRLQRSVLLNVMESHAEFNEKVWDSFYLRRFRAVLTNSLRFREQKGEIYDAWFAEHEMLTLDANEEQELHAPWHFVALGSLECERDGLWLTFRAPALLETRNPIKVRATDATKILCLDHPESPVVVA